MEGEAKGKVGYFLRVAQAVIAPEGSLYSFSTDLGLCVKAGGEDWNRFQSP